MGIHQAYENYLVAGSPFYEMMSSEQNAGASFPIAKRPLPDGWRRYEQGDWFVIHFSRSGMPAQGWKIHASATMDNAERILDKVWDYCVPRGIEFKFLRSPSALMARVSKNAPRGYSGK